jgi:hypothetical protein
MACGDICTFNFLSKGECTPAISSMNASLGLRDHGTLLTVISVALAFTLISCSSGRTEQPAGQTIMDGDVAPGVILVDILKSGRPENYWQYEVRPTAGSIRKVTEEIFPDYSHENIPHVFLQPAGAIGACSSNIKAVSHDEKYLAYCSGSQLGLFVTDKSAGIVSHWMPDEWRGIRGFGWAPNSQSVAILNISSYYGKSPIERLSGLFGHPVPHDTVFLDILDVRTGKTTEYLVRENVPYSFTRILKWSQ